jgi:hypothetical protein
MRHARDDYLVNDRNERLLIFRRGGEIVDLRELGTRDRQRLLDQVAYTPVFGIRLPGELPTDDELRALGEAMRVESSLGQGANSDIPAGYTYLGQFIFHDITAMIRGRTDPRDWKNGRTPSLDLDSVLQGLKPQDDPKVAIEQGLFRIGRTSGDAQIPEDLPRIPAGGAGEGTPRINDSRNDDFLPLAQCHLLLLKFYNAVARHRGYEGGEQDEEWWRETKKTWVQHFQWIVLRDYLPRIIDEDTYNDVLDNPRKIVRTDVNERDWFPLEVAGAIGRFGHSMIRDGYKPWNRHQDWQDVDVDHFLEFSYLNSGDGLARHSHKISGLWASNWLRLFDFANSGYGGAIPAFIPSAGLDARLACKLFMLPDCLLEDMCTSINPMKGCDEDREGFNLASTTLARGRELGLATAQQALDAVDGLLGAPLPRLTYDELFPAGFDLEEGCRDRLAEATPLWYYILREAECARFGRGRRLGPLGGRMVMETFHAAISASAESILANPGWGPSLPSAQSGQFTMPDLILFSAEPNPLG